MKVLLQDAQTKLFYAAQGRWVKEKPDALNFERVERAAQVYETENLPFAEIVIEDDNAPLSLGQAPAEAILAQAKR